MREILQGREGCMKRICVATAFALAALLTGPARAEPPGPEVCKGCHEPYFNSLANSIHGKAGHPRSPAAGGGRATRHGAGTEHLKADDRRGGGGTVNPG